MPTSQPLPRPRSVLRWLNERRSAQQLLAGLRRALPGDEQFGDPLSTAGGRPLDLVASRAYGLQHGRLSLLGETALLALQLAEWLVEDRGTEADGMAIVFTDLEGFSTWALDAGDEHSLELLRRVDVIVTSAVLEHGGTVVKRLGDGAMATFADPLGAAIAADQAVAAVGRISYEGYAARMRAAVRWGSPHAIGGDYVGVDVNIAARMCEAARPGEVLICEEVRRRLDDRWRVTAGEPASLKGIPDDLRIHGVRALPFTDVFGEPRVRT
jgi:adenylate cyclase